MSQSTLAGYQSTGTTEAPTLTDDDTSARTVICDVATEGVNLDSFDVFRAVAECTEDTIHRVRP